MTPQLPVEDPSRSGSFGDRTAAYVWGHPLLRAALIVTLANHVAAIVLVVAGWLSAAMAGLLGLLSVLTWFFAVVLPLMNREVRSNAGVAQETYWSELVEMFGRVVLSAQTLFYTALLGYAILAVS